jgi:hypothetical protein
VSVEEESVAEILRRHVETERVYASYWRFSPNRDLEELHVAAHLLAYLEVFEGWTDPKVSHSEPRRDPPDCYGARADGGRFGIEVTEFVHRNTAERHELRRHAERRRQRPKPGAADAGEVADWTAPALAKELARLVSEKDKSPVEGPFNPYLVAIFTDETMLTEQLVKEVIDGVRFESNYLDGAYLLLSYDPRCENLPNRIPIFKLPVVKVIPR